MPEGAAWDAARRRLNARGSVVSFRRSCADNWREAEGRCCVTWLSAGPELAAFLRGGGVRGWAKQSGRAVGTRAGEPAEATGGLARRFTRGEGRRDDTGRARSLLRLAASAGGTVLPTGGLALPAGVRACSFIFAGASRAFSQNKTAFARKTGSVQARNPGLQRNVVAVEEEEEAAGVGKGGEEMLDACAGSRPRAAE